jgi:hypothetical protein
MHDKKVDIVDLLMDARMQNFYSHRSMSRVHVFIMSRRNLYGKSERDYIKDDQMTLLRCKLWSLINYLWVVKLNKFKFIE